MEPLQILRSGGRVLRLKSAGLFSRLNADKSTKIMGGRGGPRKNSKIVGSSCLVNNVPAIKSAENPAPHNNKMNAQSQKV